MCVFFSFFLADEIIHGFSSVVLLFIHSLIYRLLICFYSVLLHRFVITLHRLVITLVHSLRLGRMGLPFVPLRLTNTCCQSFSTEPSPDQARFRRAQSCTGSARPVCSTAGKRRSKPDTNKLMHQLNAAKYDVC